jgi:8-oxo-dGTP pyrophosphatase MutT (NUDIX family)
MNEPLTTTSKKSDGATTEGLGLRAQIGALPWRTTDGLEILLLSSRETKRWVIPKGWPVKGKKPHRAAELEAYEEGRP